MNKTERASVFDAAIAALTKRQRARLREHARRGTRILCGDLAGLWIIGRGG